MTPLYGPICTLGVRLDVPESKIEWWSFHEGPDSIWLSMEKGGKERTGVTLTSDDMRALRKIFKKQINRLENDNAN